MLTRKVKSFLPYILITSFIGFGSVNFYRSSGNALLNAFYFSILTIAFQQKNVTSEFPLTEYKFLAIIILTRRFHDEIS